MLGHSFGHLLDNRIELQRCSLEHADLFVKVNEIRLVQFVFSVFLDVVVSFHVEELAQLWIELSFLKDVLSETLILTSKWLIFEGCLERNVSFANF